MKSRSYTTTDQFQSRVEWKGFWIWEWNDDDDYDKGKIHHIRYKYTFVSILYWNRKCECTLCEEEIERKETKSAEKSKSTWNVYILFDWVCVCWAGICVSCHNGLSHQRYQQTHIQCNAVAFYVSHFLFLLLLSCSRSPSSTPTFNNIHYKHFLLFDAYVCMCEA